MITLLMHAPSNGNECRVPANEANGSKGSKGKKSGCTGTSEDCTG